MSTARNISRLPLPGTEHQHLPVGSLDVLPMLAAATWPDRVALHGDGATVTFADLDRSISRLAAGFRALVGGEGSTIAVAAQPGPAFAVAYYAALRSGNVVAPISPRLGAEVLDRLLRSVPVRAAVLTHSMYDRSRPLLGGIPGLEQVLLLDRPAAGGGVPTCAELGSRGDLLVEPRDRDETTLAAIAFGGSGHARTAGRSHHALKLEAVRTATAHGLSATAVALNALPHYQPEHLNAAIWAGATQVFCASQDPVVLARETERCRATHCYRLPGEHLPVTMPRAVAS
ncbi:class I adenylate-forming enzyme family protein [Actinophytocola sp.]|uniref:class I adenylate-forming enzyme family protein n=1 Tax=Actinophytocola sp. TaxID=1872138 RepID=UPI002D7EE3CA|nr:class I adenylate-forming enzyme family protein [Actinophytocola sp.]HET9138084.1 class I adenylate-forming enzyme family protein [Actinophytocola sp.]HEU5110456.1 class I adenylate-forming enzyme family protein [Micromonosporaceae bacterium]